MSAALEGGEWSAARPGHILAPGRTRYTFYRRMGGTQGRSGRKENLIPTGIRSPDRPARSRSLYRLSYRAHTICKTLAGGSSVGSRLMSCMCNAHHSRSGEGTLLKQVWQNAGHSSDFSLVNSSYST